MPESSGGLDPCLTTEGCSRGTCHSGTGVLQASYDTCPGDGGLLSCIPYHGPTSCTHVVHPTTVYIPLAMHSSSPAGSLLAGLPQALTRSALTGTGICAAKQPPCTPAAFLRSRRHTPLCTALAQHPAVAHIPSTPDTQHPPPVSSRRNPQPHAVLARSSPAVHTDVHTDVHTRTHPRLPARKVMPLGRTVAAGRYLHWSAVSRAGDPAVAVSPVEPPDPAPSPGKVWRPKRLKVI